MNADQANAHYEAIKKDLPNISIEEMRARHGPLAALSKSTLNEVLKKQGYPAEPTKQKALGGLLDNLTSLKISHDQIGRIARSSEQFSEGNHSLRGVEIFEIGNHRGKDYTPEDRDDMVRNFRQFCTGQKPGFAVPAVLGHEEGQDLLDRSDLPAAGWMTDLYSDGDKILADFDDVPDEVAKLIRAKRYRTCSAEIYDEPPEGIPGKGKMLRRVAFLGGDIPQLKNLRDIPMPKKHGEDRRFAQWRRVNLPSTQNQCEMRGSFYRTYHEVKPMGIARFGPAGDSPQGRAMWSKVSLSGAKNKNGSYSKRKLKKGTPKGGWGFDEDDTAAETPTHEDMIKYLTDLGMDAAKLADTPDEALAEMCRYAASLAEDGDDGDGDAGEQDFADAAGNDIGDDSLPEIQNAQEARDYAEKVRRMADHARKGLKRFCSQHAEGDGGGDAAAGGDAAGDDSPVSSETAETDNSAERAAQYRERGLERLVTRVVNRALNAQIKEKMDRFEKFTESQLSSQKKQAIEAFLETNRQAGKVLPFELDLGNPANLYDRLMRADAVRTVRRFREGKKEAALTELDLQMREIEQRPVRAFSELVKKGGGFRGGKPGSVEADAEVEKIEDAFDRFSESFPRGINKETLVEGFKAEKKVHPDLMAEDFLEGLAV